MVDATDLKSVYFFSVGSSPTEDMIHYSEFLIKKIIIFLCLCCKHNSFLGSC